MKKNLSLGDLFSSFKKSAKRLELLQEYHIEGDEWDSFQKFINGEAVSPYPELAEWNEQISEWRKQGKTIERIRLLENPLSEYLKYEIFEAYVPGTIVGQKINFVSPKQLEKVVGKKKLKDFWIFDDKYVFEMDYDENHNYCGGRIVDGVEEKEIYQRLLEISQPLETVLKQIRLQGTEIKL